MLDPLKIVQSFAGAALQRGASFECTEVRAIQPLEGRVTLHTSSKTLTVDAVVVCTGAWTASLLEPLGLRVPMESARGYHVELAGHPPLADTPILYVDKRIYVTPMEGRLRATSFMEFAGTRPHPTRENWHDCVRALGSSATIAPPTARAGLDHDRCFPTIFRASVVSNAPLSSMPSGTSTSA